MKSFILDNARKLRGIYFIDPEDKEFEETIKNARKKLETPIAPAMPCKIIENNKNCGNGASNKVKSKLAVFWKLVNVQDCVWENHCRLIMKTILQEKETIHYSIIIWSTIFLMPQAMKIPAAKAAVDKEWEKLDKNSAWNLMKVRSKKEMKQGRKAPKFISLRWWSFEGAELEAKHQKYKGQVVLRGDIVKDDSGACAVFTEQGSSASQMTAAKVMDIISRLTQYLLVPKLKRKMHPNY